MQQPLLTIAFVTLSVAALIVSCKKDETTPANTTTTSSTSSTSSTASTASTNTTASTSNTASTSSTNSTAATSGTGTTTSTTSSTSATSSTASTSSTATTSSTGTSSSTGNNANNTMTVGSDTYTFSFVNGVASTTDPSNNYYGIVAGSSSPATSLIVNLYGTAAPVDGTNYTVTQFGGAGNTNPIMSVDGKSYTATSGTITCNIVEGKVRITFSNMEFKNIMDATDLRQVSAKVTVL